MPPPSGSRYDKRDNFHFAADQLRKLWERVPSTNGETALTPQDLATEKSVLGLMMIDARAAEVIASMLGNAPMAQSPFYDERHGLIYRAAAHLATKGEPVDMLTVTDLLRKGGKLEQIGGASYLVELTQNIVTAVGTERHCRIILEKRLARDLLMETGGLQAKLWAGGDVFDALAETELRLDQLRTGTNPNKRKSQMLGPAIHPALVDVAARAGRTGISGIPTGVKGFDDMVGGLERGELSIWAGVPSGGKSCSAVTLAKNIALCPDPEKRTAVGFFSIEMTTQQIVLRIVSCEAQVSANRIKHNNLTDREVGELHLAAGRLADAKIYIQDDSMVTPLDIRFQARSLERFGVGLIIVDYLQIVKPSERNNVREREVTEITQQLKDTAKMLNVHVMALAQYNRQNQVGGGRRPILSDLKEAGSIEQIADVVTFLHHGRGTQMNDREGFFEGGEPMEWIVAKNRNGPIGTIPVRFFPYYSLFEDDAGGMPMPEERDHPKGAHHVPAQESVMADDYGAPAF